MRRVLLIRLTALGDVILVEPVARALKSHFEGVEIDLLTGTKAAPLMASAQSIDRVFSYDRHGQDSGWSGLGRVLRRLSGHYDLVVDLQGKARTRILSWRVPAARRLRFSKRSALQGFLSLLGWDPPLTGTHAVDLYLSVLKPLGIQAEQALTPRLQLSPAKNHKPTKARIQIGLSAGTTHATKQWSASSFAELATRIAASQPKVNFTLLGGPNDREILGKIRAIYPGDNISSLDTSEISVKAMSEVIAELDLFVGVDSGPTHIAAALGVPVVALFGPTSPSRWGPRGAGHERLSLALDCSPCSNVGGARCPDSARDHECMRALKVEDVQQAVFRVLRASGRLA